MSVETFESVLHGLQAVDCGLVAFMGGEPTLHRDLPSMVAQARAADMLTHLSTNGLLLTPDYIDELCKAGLHVFNLSIDSVKTDSPIPKVLDEVRESIDVLIEKRREYGYSIYVNQVLLPENLDQVVPMAEYLTRRDINLTVTFADRGELTEDDSTGFAGFDNPKMLAALDSTVEQLIALKQQGHTIATSQAYLRAAQHFAHDGRAPMYCMAGVESLQVDTDGRIRLCSRSSTVDHLLHLYAPQLTAKRWRALRTHVDAIVRKCNPICLAACQFETAYLCRHPWEVVPSFLMGSSRHLHK